MTGRARGADVDGGSTTVRSPRFRLPDDRAATLRLRYWVGLDAAAGPLDGLTVRLVDAAGEPVGGPLLVVAGDGTDRAPAWRDPGRRAAGRVAGAPAWPSSSWRATTPATATRPWRRPSTPPGHARVSAGGSARAEGRCAPLPDRACGDALVRACGRRSRPSVPHPRTTPMTQHLLPPPHAAPGRPRRADVRVGGSGAGRGPPADYPQADAGYHSYAEMSQEIHDLEAANPGILRVSSIGESVQGRQLWIAKVSDNVGDPDEPNEPEVLFDALHHAREHLTVEMALSVLHLLVDRYGEDPAWAGGSRDDRRRPGHLDRVHGEPGRPGLGPDGPRAQAGVRPGRGALLRRLAQEPPGPRRHQGDGHRPQPELRLPVGLLRRLLVATRRADQLPRPPPLVTARGRGAA